MNDFLFKKLNNKELDVIYQIFKMKNSDLEKLERNISN